MRTQLIPLLGLVLFPALLQANSAENLLVDAEISRGVLSSNGIEWTVRARTVTKGQQESFTLQVKTQEDKALAEILSPESSKGSKYLLSGGGMWFYRQGTKRPVSIPRRNRVAGDAAIGDIASTSFLEEYRIESTEQDSFNGESCTVYSLKQKLGKRPAYSTIKLWVSNSARVSRQAHFFTPSGKHIRTATYKHNSRITVRGRSVPFISELKVTDLLGTPKSTTLNFTNYRIVSSFPKDTFDLKSMAGS